MLKKQKYDDIYILIYTHDLVNGLRVFFGFKRNYITLSHGLAKFQEGASSLVNGLGSILSLNIIF